MRLLLVEDDAYARQNMRRIVAGIPDVDLDEATSLMSARQLLSRGSFDVALVDIELDGAAGNRDGLTLLREMHEHRAAVPIVVTASSAMAEIREAMRLGAHSYILKDELCPELVLPLLRELRDRRTLAEQILDLNGLVGGSSAMARLRTRVAKVAASDAPVLITGPSGAGKELVARAIHALSRRAREPLVSVNCGAFTESLVEAQLFGHDKGAFTGADRARPGLLAAARRGTLFLDEIGELAPALQTRLLRVLENRTFRAVGAATETEFHGRVLAATHVDLCTRIAEGRFREDLFYRLEVLTVEVPPLADRRDDIPALAAHFAQQTERQVRLTEAALAALAELDWPGNVRQLRNVIYRLAVFAEGTTIDADDVRAGAGVLSPSPGPAVARPSSADGLAALAAGVSPYAPRKHNEARLSQNQIRFLEERGMPMDRVCDIMGIGRATYFRIKAEKGQG